MNAVGEIEATVQRVPIWGWGALGAGVLVIYMAKRHATAAAATDPNAVDPNAAYAGTTIPDYSTSPGSTPDPMANPFTSTLPLIGASSAAGTATYAPATYTERLTDILGGTLPMFANSLTNAPNEIDLTMPGGVSLTTKNNVGTFGGGNGTLLQSPDQTNADTQSFAAKALAQLQAFIAQTTAQDTAFKDQTYAQHIAYVDQTTAMSQAYNQQIAAQQGWLQQLLGIGAPASSGGVVTPAPTVAQTIAACASGNFSCIKGACAPGDAACAKGVAPWWNGAPIGGWSAGY